jgi:hypothetical protein
MSLQVGDTVIFTRTIWQGRIGTIKEIDKYGRITVDIPGTTCVSRHEYSISAVKKYKNEA